MKDGRRLVITIGRQFGSGGREIGSRLAEELGIGFYDKNILRMNSNESGIKESYYHLADERPGSRLLYKIIKGLTPELGAPSFGSDLVSADNLFRFQSEVIRQLASRGDMAILLVEQFYDFAAGLADHYLVMSRGAIVQQGKGGDMERDGVRAMVTI